MTYIGVKFREQGLIYYFDGQGQEIKKGDKVVVTTEEGVGLALVFLTRETPPEGLPEKDIKPVERVAEAEDLQAEEENIRMGREAFAFCKTRIRESGLEMKLVDVEVRFDRSKMIFYFTAPSRVDFRELIKALVNKYRTRIELRQIGVRHEAQILGGIGDCGRGCCCSTFLRRFDPVTIKMAKEQQLFLNPSKISGCCGRLLCCLNFEREFYSDFYKKCPKIGKKYETAAGEVKVLRANIFQDSLVVDAGGGQEKEISLPEWQELVSGQGDSSFLNTQIPTTSAASSSQEKGKADQQPAAVQEKAVEQKEAGASNEQPQAEHLKKRGKRSGARRKGKSPSPSRRNRRKTKQKK
ncbi:MAG: hypothetical protein K9K64_08110 [Desulfohalobiaceae bacterium]|nr:hypothetical protein [Desulfohalobiaceae bacterium]